MPAAHDAQTVRPEASVNLPLAHSWQTDTPVEDALNVPAVQFVHAVDELLALNLPMPQTRQRVAPLLTVYVPAEHDVHVERPLVSEYLPLAQSGHDTTSVDGLPRAVVEPPRGAVGAHGTTAGVAVLAGRAQRARHGEG